MKTVYILWRNYNSHNAPMAVYDTRESAMNALSALAGVLNTEVKQMIAPEKWIGMGELPTWNDDVTDNMGATYYITDEDMAEDEHIIDLC